MKSLNACSKSWLSTAVAIDSTQCQDSKLCAHEDVLIRAMQAHAGENTLQTQIHRHACRRQTQYTTWTNTDARMHITYSSPPNLRLPWSQPVTLQLIRAPLLPRPLRLEICKPAFNRNKQQYIAVEMNDAADVEQSHQG